MGTKTLLTLEQFLRLPDDGMHHELNRGELITMPPPMSAHSEIVRRVHEALLKYVLGRASGRVYVEAGFLLHTEPRTIRQPDVSFLSADRAELFSEHRYFEGAPELAVEVVSPANTAQDLEDKIEQYLAFGARAVWVIYPKQRRVRIYRAGGEHTALYDTDEITETELFPGLSIPVREILG
ncbi:MAG: Uma2 family endonuclease [Acidobacteriota bacterium]|nr:Uma2 family endonuclease [Acidobacteriota bacterium]